MYPLFFRGQDLGRGLRFTAALFTALWNAVSIRSGAAIDSMARETSANRHFSDSTTYTNSGATASPQSTRKPCSANIRSICS